MAWVCYGVATRIPPCGEWGELDKDAGRHVLATGHSTGPGSLRKCYVCKRTLPDNVFAMDTRLGRRRRSGRCTQCAEREAARRATCKQWSLDDRIAQAVARAAEVTGASEIPDHPGYLVSPTGEVWTVLRGRGVRPEPLQLVQWLNRGGYNSVRLKGSRSTVHRLVARTFLGPRPPGMEVRHLDGDRANPALTNLAYGTPRENARDRIAHGTMLYGERAPFSKWTDAEVSAAIDLYLAGGITQEAVGELYGTSQQVVSRWVTARNLPSRYPKHPTTSGTARGTAWARRTT